MGKKRRLQMQKSRVRPALAIADVTFNRAGVPVCPGCLLPMRIALMSGMFGSFAPGIAGSVSWTTWRCSDCLHEITLESE